MHHFTYSDLEIAQMTKAQINTIQLTGYKQSLSNFSFLSFTITRSCLYGNYAFLNNYIVLLCQCHDTPSGHTQYSCEVGTSNIFP